MYIYISKVRGAWNRAVRPGVWSLELSGPSESRLS